MAVDLHPFRALRPRPELAEQIASPPYDVLNSGEAREMAAGNPISFLHVNKPEIDLPVEIDPYDDRVYTQGKQNLTKLVEQAYLREESACFYVYQQRMGDHVQAGLVAGASVDDYQQDRIKKHELTRADKERDRIRHVDTLAAHTGPVFLTYRAEKEIDRLVDGIRAEPPVYDFTSPDEVGHTFWVISDREKIATIRRCFAAMECVYVADGHHRSAAGSAVRDLWRQRKPELPADHEVNYFLAVVFPHDQMQILDYNRVVMDLAGLTPAAFLERVAEKFEVQETTSARPDRARCFGMFLDGSWYRLTARAGSFEATDPVRALDVSILMDNLLAPVLGIGDPRTDKRIDFVGGIRGTVELERRCGLDAAVAFSMFPTSMEQLMAIADAGKMMPPKSTWFEPKLRSGLVIHTFDDVRA